MGRKRPFTEQPPEQRHDSRLPRVLTKQQRTSSSSSSLTQKSSCQQNPVRNQTTAGRKETQSAYTVHRLIVHDDEQHQPESLALLHHSRPVGAPIDEGWGNTPHLMRFPGTPEERMNPTTSSKSSKKRSSSVHNLSPRIQLRPLSQAPSQKSNSTSTQKSKLLYSYFKNFISEDDGDDEGSYRTDVDLAQHARDSGVAVTDATVAEVAKLMPNLEILRLGGCSDVTDAGLWALAEHCADIRELHVEGCVQLTALGLRTLPMKCPYLHTLNLSQCPQLRDVDLRAVAAGCWNLRKLVLRECLNVSDAGLAEVARCCKNLMHLDVSDCPHVGEYGDAALTALGKHCSQLQVLDLYGCQHVRDSGVLAIAKGCPMLHTLKLTGCRDVTSVACRKLARHCPLLTILSLAGCRKTTNDDLARLGKACPLIWLDISGSPNLTYVGIQALAHSCPTLSTLATRHCPGMTDEALAVLASSAPQLQVLDITACRSITEAGLSRFYTGCKSCFTLSFGQCAKLSKRYCQDLAEELEFVTLTSSGFVPRPGALALYQAKRQRLLETESAVKIQALIRGVAARGGVWQLKLAQVARETLPKIQARVRGHLCRQERAREKLRQREWECAIVIQRVVRGHWGRRVARRARRVRRIAEHEDEAALIFQKIFRGHRARLEVAAIREELYIEQQRVMREHILLEQAVLFIQRAYRGKLGRNAATLQRLYLQAQVKHQQLEIASAKTIQRLARGRAGRRVRNALLAERARIQDTHDKAKKVQAIVRGRAGRVNASRCRDQRKIRRFRNAATKIQSRWRGLKERHLALLVFHLVELRRHEALAVVRIQQCFRGYAARGIVKALRGTMARRRLEHEMATKIQALYRGHRGRTEFEVQRELRKRLKIIEPLMKQLATNEEQVARASENLDKALAVYKVDQEDEVLLTHELDKVMQIKTKYHDSARLTGTSQRFLTKFLEIQLADQLRTKRGQLALQSKQLEVKTAVKSEAEKKLRMIKKALKPHTDGIERQTREGRSMRLRAHVRAERAAAIAIQATFRRYRVQCAVAEGANYWIQLYNQDQNRDYYYNTWNEQTRWSRPLAMDIFGDSIGSATDHISETLLESESQDTENDGNEPQPHTSNWTEALDPESGYYYYFNSVTGECQWTNPEEADAVETTDDQVLKTIGEWEEHIDPTTQKLYYYHPVTQESKWSLTPREAHSSRTSGRRSARSLSDNRQKSARWLYTYGHEYNDQGQLIRAPESRSAWTEEFDEASGHVYYQNHISGECRWEKPEDFDIPVTKQTPNSSRDWFAEQNPTTLKLTGRSQHHINSARVADARHSQSQEAKEEGPALLRTFGDWEEIVDPDSGHTYYYNTVTDESKWSLSPREVADLSTRSNERPGQKEPLDDIVLPEKLRARLELMHENERTYAKIETHQAWLDDAIRARDWVKAEGLVEQMLCTKNEPEPTVEAVEETETEIEIETDLAAAENTADVKSSSNDQPWDETWPATEDDVDPTQRDENPKDEDDDHIIKPKVEEEWAVEDNQYDQLSSQLEPQDDDWPIEDYEKHDKASTMEADADDAWVELDDGNGNVYYYNQVSGESQWDPPSFKVEASNALLERYGDGDDAAQEGEQHSALEIEQAVRRAFADFDADDTGTIDKKELGALLASLDYPVDEYQIDQAMQSFDTSGDGQVGIEEFVHWWTSGGDIPESEYSIPNTEENSITEPEQYQEEGEEYYYEYPSEEQQQDNGYDHENNNADEYNTELPVADDPYLQEEYTSSPDEEWQSIDDGAGSVYYYNVITGETAWEIPAKE